MRSPSPFLVGLLFLPLDIWLILRLREHLGLLMLILALAATGIVLARARPPGWFTRVFLRARAERHDARTPFWRAALAALAAGAWFLPTPAAPFLAGYLAARCATTEYAHWHARRLRAVAPLAGPLRA